MLARREGISDLALTTNGLVAGAQRPASALRGGLDRVTVILDALEP